MSKSVFFLLAISLAVAASQSTPVKKCKGVTEDLFKKVVVSTPKGICTKLPCDLASGRDVVANITFLVRKEVEQITLKCNATSLGITIDYPIPDAEKGCDRLTNTYCPIQPKTEAELSLVMNVLKAFPKVSLTLVFYMTDQAQRMISCFEMSAKVVAGKYMLTQD